MKRFGVPLGVTLTIILLCFGSVGCLYHFSEGMQDAAANEGVDLSKPVPQALVEPTLEAVTARRAQRHAAEKNELDHTIKIESRRFDAHTGWIASVLAGAEDVLKLPIVQELAGPVGGLAMPALGVIGLAAGVRKGRVEKARAENAHTGLSQVVRAVEAARPKMGDDGYEAFKKIASALMDASTKAKVAETKAAAGVVKDV